MGASADLVNPAPGAAARDENPDEVVMLFTAIAARARS